MGPGLFRFLLATVVVVYHYTSFGIGHAPVYLFFALSGYWVYMMWTRKYEAARDPYMTFLLSRIWRLGPVFILCSTIAVAGVTILPQFVAPQIAFSELTPHALISSFAILGYNTAYGAPLVPAWSLDIELQFYLVAPLLIVLLQRRPLVACVASLVVCFASVAVFHDRASTSYLPWFMAGMLAARFPSLLGKPSLATGSGCATLAVVLLFAAVPSLRHVLFGGAHQTATYVTYNPLLNIGLALVALPFALQTVKTQAGSFDRFLSDASYSLYLVHWMPLFFVSHYFPQLRGEPHFVGLFVTACMVGTSYLAAFGVTACIDRPLNLARSRFFASRHEERTAPVSA